MYTAIIVLIIIAAVLLMIFVLAQDAKGGGITAQFGGATQMMGTKKTTELIEKITWGFAIAIAFLCLSTTFFVDRTSGALPKSVNIEKAKSKKSNTPNPLQVPPKGDEKKSTPPTKQESKEKK